MCNFIRSFCRWKMPFQHYTTFYSMLSFIDVFCVQCLHITNRIKQKTLFQIQEVYYLKKNHFMVSLRTSFHSLFFVFILFTVALRELTDQNQKNIYYRWYPLSPFLCLRSASMHNVAETKNVWITIYQRNWYRTARLRTVLFQTDWLSGFLNDCLTVRKTDRHTNGLTNWLTHWLTD